MSKLVLSLLKGVIWLFYPQVKSDALICIKFSSVSPVQLSSVTYDVCGYWFAEYRLQRVQTDADVNALAF